MWPSLRRCWRPADSTRPTPSAQQLRRDRALRHLFGGLGVPVTAGRGAGPGAAPSHLRRRPGQPGRGPAACPARPHAGGQGGPQRLLPDLGVPDRHLGDRPDLRCSDPVDIPADAGLRRRLQFGRCGFWRCGFWRCGFWRCGFWRLTPVPAGCRRLCVQYYYIYGVLLHTIDECSCLLASFLSSRCSPSPVHTGRLG